MPKVSIIMNCYNSDKYLKQAIDSVYQQTYTDWEIIFWDNKSTDNSPKIALSYDSKLRYFLADEFLSLGAARNKAIAEAKGDYIAFLDCDDEWLPEKLEKQIAYFNKNPDVDFIYTNSYFVNTLYNTKKLEHTSFQPEGKIFAEQLNQYSVSIPTVIFQRCLLDKLEYLFDERFNIIEEYDIFMRLFVYANVGYINEPLAIYRIHGENGFIKGRKQWIIETEMMIEIFRNMDDISQIAGTDWDRKIKHKIVMETVKLHIANGENILAREKLKNGAAKVTSISLILALLTFLPPALSVRLYQALSEIYKKKVIYKA